MAEKKGRKIARALNAMPLREFLEFSDLVHRFEYLLRETFRISGLDRQVCQLYMIRCGSGITGSFQSALYTWQSYET